MQFPCNKSKEEQIIYGDGGLKTLSTLFVLVGSSIWGSDAADISVIEVAMHIHSRCRRMYLYRDKRGEATPSDAPQHPWASCWVEVEDWRASRRVWPTAR